MQPHGAAFEFSNAIGSPPQQHVEDALPPRPTDLELLCTIDNGTILHVQLVLSDAYRLIITNPDALGDDVDGKACRQRDERQQEDGRR